MGALISRWKAKLTTVGQLEILEKEINELEEFRAKNNRLQKLWVGRFLFYSSVLYLLTSLVVYCLYLPEQWLHRLAMALPFFLYPVLVWFVRKLLIIIFYKRTERNNDKLEDLKEYKRKILEKVMETETYKNAKLILERFDPEARRRAELESTPVLSRMIHRPGQELRQRGEALRPMPMGTPVAMTMTPVPVASTPIGPGATLVEPVPLSAPGGPPERSSMSPSVLQGVVPRTHCSPIPGVGMHPPGPQLARPILPRNRGAVDRVIEYLVGDGPQNRYALICQQCFSHNGMALKEEFEYLAFRCAYCYFLNPARKTRPQAPRLPEFSFERRLRAESPGPTLRYGTDTEESAPPSGAKAPAPWNLVHSFSTFQIRQSPENPQTPPPQSPDEKEMGEEAESTEEVMNESRSEEQIEKEVQTQEEEEEVVEEEVLQSPNAPCETESRSAQLRNIQKRTRDD